MSQRSSRVDEYIDNASDFAQPILKEIREVFHETSTEIEEGIKWGMPAFMYKGIVSNLAAFKNHVSFGFWKGKLMKDPQGIFNDRERTQICAIKLTSVDDIPDRKILKAYVLEAIELNEKGIKLPTLAGKKARPKLLVPKDFSNALKSDPTASKKFKSFSFSNRRDYIEWITKAKRDDTRARRLLTAIEWISEGKPRNWKYMKKK